MEKAAFGYSKTLIGSCDSKSGRKVGMQSSTVSVIIPAYNEEAAIGNVLRELTRGGINEKTITLKLLLSMMGAVIILQIL